jgi:hypothetical protein
MIWNMQSLLKQLRVGVRKVTLNLRTVYIKVISPMNREIYRRKLDELLGRAEDISFCQLVWAVDALQSGRVEAAAQIIQFPPEAASSDPASGLAIHRWELESLITRLLGTPKLKQPHAGKAIYVNCSLFQTAALSANYLRGLENAEAGVYLRPQGVFNELHRIGQRQFPWQRGYFNLPQLYRYAFIYNNGSCKDYFESTHGLTINEFSLIGFALNAAFMQCPCVDRSLSLVQLGINGRKFEAALKLLALPLEAARNEASLFVNEAAVPTAYNKSLLRQHPIIGFTREIELLCAPLPQLLMLRVTAGVFYDLVGGGAGLRNDASGRFEQYCAELTQRLMPRFQVRRSERYLIGRRPMDTPDVLVSDRNEVRIVVECKARRLSFGAQFAEDPIEEAVQGYEEMAKGVIQLWRYFSHNRRGILRSDVVNAGAHAVVLTLDTWLAMSDRLVGHVLSKAHELADVEREISPEDRRHVTFCSIADFESVLSSCDEDGLLNVLSAAGRTSFRSWLLPSIQRELRANRLEQKQFPFEVGSVLPWWDSIPAMRRAAQL